MTRQPTALVRYEQPAPPMLAPQSIQELEVLGNICAASGFFQDSKQAAQAMVKIAAGQELGLSPIQSMTGIHVIKNRITLSANLMAALLKRAGYKLKVKWPDGACCITVIDPDGEELGESSFSIQDAKQAGLTTDNWKKYPRNMLYARAVSNAARWYAPEVLTGVYLPDELETVGHSPGDVPTYARVSSDEIPVDDTRPVHEIAPKSRYHTDTVEVEIEEFPEQLKEQAREMRLEQLADNEDWKDASRRLHAVANEAGFEHSELKFLLGCESTKDAHAQQLYDLADAIEGWNDNQVAVAKLLLMATNLPMLKSAWDEVRNGQRKQLAACKNYLKSMMDGSTE